MFSAIRDALTPKSIRSQLTLWYLVMLSAALIAFAIVVFIAREQTLYREADADLEIAAQRLVSELQPKLLELDPTAALEDDPRLATEPIEVRERYGTVIYRSPAFPALRGSGEAAAVAAARAGDPIAVVEDRSGNEFRLATVVVARTGAMPVTVQTVASTSPLHRILRQLLLTMCLWLILVLSVASYGGRFIARRALRPVDAIVDRVCAIQANDMETRLDVRAGSEELDRLVETLNGMLDRLETSMQGARRFAADASHELQTPIAAMRAAIESSLRRDGDEASQATLADDLLIDLERLSTLVRDLRLLSLADAGHLLDRVEPVDLNAIVHDCCDVMLAGAEPKDVTVSVDVLSDVAVLGNALHLRRALLNLAQNAVRYSPPGGTVQLTVARVDDCAVLVLVDEGCGIAPADLPHIFERFYRADKARARATGGSGLGLAIADQIIRSHGGRIELSSIVDQGTTIVVYLPVADVALLSSLPERSVNVA